MIATQKGNENIVSALVHAGADVNLSRRDGQTALMKAAYDGQITIVNAMLQEGADVNKVDNRGLTALLEAAKKGHAKNC